MHDWYAHEGSPSPLGVTWVEDEAAYNFALYSKHATAVTLSALFRDRSLNANLRTQARSSRRTSRAASGTADCGRAQFLKPATTVIRSRDRSSQNKAIVSIPRKVLLDPYARMRVLPNTIQRDGGCGPGSNAGKAPLGLIATEPEDDWAGDETPAHRSDLVIYELHVRGFTRRANSGVSSGSSRHVSRRDRENPLSEGTRCHCG